MIWIILVLYIAPLILSYIGTRISYKKGEEVGGMVVLMFIPIINCIIAMVAIQYIIETIDFPSPNIDWDKWNKRFFGERD